MYVTPEEAKERWCPAAMGNTEVDVKCCGPTCMAWRWRPIVADEAYIEALVKCAQDIGDKSPAKAKAAKHLNANRAAYGLPEAPTHGRCGLAGE